MIDKLKKQMVGEGYSFKSLTSILIFGAICLVFVFFGLPSRNRSTGAGAAARVNDSLISVADVRGETQRLEQMYAPMFGGNFGGDAQRQFIRNQAVENLISMELITQAAQKEGILVTDVEVRDFIVREIPVFQKDGKFQRELYQNYLDYSHTAASEFEDKIRKDRKTQRARRIFEVAAVPLGLEVQKLTSLKEKKMNVSFAKIDKDQWLEKTAVPESELKAKLAQADFQKRVEDYFKSNKSEFTTEAQVHAQHILIKAEAGNAESQSKALEKINEIKKRAEKEDFVKLAKEYSEDSGSKDKGGDLGFFAKGRMVPEFETAAFTQPVGEVGMPVKTNYGYHLIKVIEKKNAEEPTIAKHQNAIAKKLILTEKFDGEIKSLEEALVKSDITKVDQIIKSWGLNWEETGFFDLAQDSVPKLTGQVVSQAAFELSETRPLLNRLVRDGGAKFVMKIKASKSETVKDPSILSEMAKENSYGLFSQWIESAKKSAKIEKNNELIQGR
jgi:peptidyl-prolyl cis-trans isomerase D